MNHKTYFLRFIRQNIEILNIIIIVKMFEDI